MLARCCCGAAGRSDGCTCTAGGACRLLWQEHAGKFKGCMLLLLRAEQSSHSCISWISDCCPAHPPTPCPSSSETEDEDGWQHVERPAAQLPGQYRSITHANELSWEDEIQI